MTASGSGCWLGQATATSNASGVWPFRRCRARISQSYLSPVNRCRVLPGYGTCVRGRRRRQGTVLRARRLLGDQLSRDIFVEYAADQSVIGYSLPGSTVLEGLEVHLREANGQ